METVLLVVHLMIAASLVGLVLVQRSEGGALGIGGSGGGAGGGLMTGRGAANVLTRMTGYAAAAFFATSITLTILANKDRKPTKSVVDGLGAPVSAPATPAKPAAPGLPSITLPNLPQVPSSK